MRKQARCLKLTWSSTDSSKRSKFRLSQKVRQRKIWLPGSSNSARRTARRSTGSAALCASWKPENSIAGVRSARLNDRARAAAGKVERTKNMVLYYLLSRDLKKIEGYQFTLRAQKNSQDSVRITDEGAVPKSYCRIDARIDGVVWETVLSLLPDELSRSLESSIQETRPNPDAIKAAAIRNEQVPGAEVRRGSHLRVA